MAYAQSPIKTWQFAEALDDSYMADSDGTMTLGGTRDSLSTQERSSMVD
jgi:hypothetical protein